MVQTKNVAEKIATKTAQTDVKNSEKLPVIIPEEKAESKKLPAKALPTFTEKLAMLEELNSLVDKRGLLREALKDVSDFYISPSGNCSIRVTDSNNKSFSISHPFVIEEVLKVVTFKLEDELDRVETLFENIF